MKNCLICFFFLLSYPIWAQQLQFHFDFRHTIDPKINRTNYPSLTFEYFKANDTIGSFLLKIQNDFNGEQKEMGQTFLQVSKSLRYWKPKVFLTLSYSGGLGIAPPSYGFYINNAFGMSLSYPFQWKGTWITTQFGYRYNAFSKPSHDFQLVFYFWKGLINYKLQISGSIVSWSQNRDLGTNFTEGMSGKKFAFFGDPQIWWKLGSKVSVGSRFNLFYHVLTDDHTLQFYPTIGIKTDI